MVSLTPPRPTSGPHPNRFGAGGDASRCFLLIDDERDICALMEALLAEAGVEADTTHGLKSASRALKNRRYDAVISDIYMPDGDGLEVLRLLRGLPIMPPVLLISGEALPNFSALSAGTRLGAQAVLQKPFVAEEFLAAVEDLLVGMGAAPACSSTPANEVMGVRS